MRLLRLLGRTCDLFKFPYIEITGKGFFNLSNFLVQCINSEQMHNELSFKANLTCMFAKTTFYRYKSMLCDVNFVTPPSAPGRPVFSGIAEY